MTYISYNYGMCMNGGCLFAIFKKQIVGLYLPVMADNMYELPGLLRIAGDFAYLMSIGLLCCRMTINRKFMKNHPQQRD